MKKVIVTGGCGFIGSHLVDKLLEKKIKVLNYGLEDIFTQSGSVQDLYKYYKLDAHSINKAVLNFLRK